MVDQTIGQCHHLYQVRCPERRVEHRLEQHEILGFLGLFGREGHDLPEVFQILTPPCFDCLSSSGNLIDTHHDRLGTIQTHDRIQIGESDCAQVSVKHPDMVVVSSSKSWEIDPGHSTGVLTSETDPG